MRSTAVAPHPGGSRLPWGRSRRVGLMMIVASSLASMLPGDLARAADAGVTATAILAAPVTPLRVERTASLPRQPWLPGHRGVDLDATVGDEVKAPASGEVSFVGVVVDRPVVSIRHANGLVTSLEPVNATVSKGDLVVSGQEVGTVAPSQGHCFPSTCVHWGVRLHGQYVDPLDYLEGFGPIRLLPWNP